LIAGGTDKNLDFAQFAQQMIAKTKNVVLLKGNATEKIMRRLKEIASDEFMAEIQIVDSMVAAVEVAREKAGEGDVVLLSPGAASFGLFANEFDRGDKFREAVKNLK
jgi:UDP-N-acetylmuramoylalanine--D-glutamate ligase